MLAQLRHSTGNGTSRLMENDHPDDADEFLTPPRKLSIGPRLSPAFFLLCAGSLFLIALLAWSY